LTAKSTGDSERSGGEGTVRVGSERHEADQESLAFHDQRRRWCDGIVSVAPDRDIDLLNVEESSVNGSYEI
jgi:hypothetical protein